MKQYLELLNKIVVEGRWQQNRTGIPTKRLDGAMLQFNLKDGFPAVTTKKLAFGQVKGELLGFIRGYNNAEQFRGLGCKVWDQNANENKAWLDNENRIGRNDLGRIYGVQWRSWIPPGEFGRENTIDQLSLAMGEIINNPTSRRIIVTAWNPAEIEQMSLPPCHMLFQFLVDVETNELSLCMYQRSCDMFLGIPFNIASYALLLELVAAATGRVAGRLTMFLADVHIYANHMGQVETQLQRWPLKLPELRLELVDPENNERGAIGLLESLEPDHIKLIGYKSHEALTGAMAV